jgi:hypothetical protein
MATANESYQKRVKEARTLLSDIGKLITKHAAKQKKEPRNWGYSGSMGNVIEELKNIKEFLNG